MKVAAGLFLAALLGAQDLKKLTLAEAEAAAIRNHPSIASARALQQASEAVTRETQANYSPTVTGILTGVGAERNTIVAAGALTTSSLANRLASGVVINQLLTDFGRTASLTKSAKLRAGAQGETVSFTRAQIILRVRQAYYRSLAAQAVLRVARQTVDARRLTLRQVTALFQSNLKSSLDVSFADVNVSEAELALFRAENEIRSSFAELAAAMALPQPNESFELTDEAMPGPLPDRADRLIADALKNRPDLASLRLSHQASLRFVDSERRLRYPTISALATAGIIPEREDKLRGHYDAAGLNVTIPVLNGGLFSARKAEAQARAESAAQEVHAAELLVARDVRVAWLNAENAFRRLDVTARLLEQATRSLRLAQSRYDLGLSSIIELTQAQLSLTSAEIVSANARYEYQAQRAVLDYETGR